LQKLQIFWGGNTGVYSDRLFNTADMEPTSKSLRGQLMQQCLFMDSQTVLGATFMVVSVQGLLVLLAHGARVSHDMIEQFEQGRKFNADKKVRIMAMSAYMHWPWYQAAFELDRSCTGMLGSVIIRRMCTWDRVSNPRILFWSRSFTCGFNREFHDRVRCFLLCVTRRSVCKVSTLPVEICDHILSMCQRDHFRTEKPKFVWPFGVATYIPHSNVAAMRWVMAALLYKRKLLW